MPDETGQVTLNEGAAAVKSSTETGVSSRSDVVTDGELMGTVERINPITSEKTEKPEEPSKDTQGKEAGDKGAEGAQVKPKEGKTDQPLTTDKGKQEVPESRADKRIKQLIDRAKKFETENAQLLQRLDSLEQRLTSGGRSSTAPDLMELSSDQILDKFNEDPKAFLSDYGRRVRDEVLGELKEHQTKNQTEHYTQRALRTFEEFGEKNQDFNDMWDEGTIKSYMEENPGHNAISAYYALTLENKINAAIESQKAQWEKEKEAAVKDAVEKLRAARVSDMGSSAGGGNRGVVSDDAKWKTEDFGGDRTTGLLARLRARRSGS